MTVRDSAPDPMRRFTHPKARHLLRYYTRRDTTLLSLRNVNAPGAVLSLLLHHLGQVSALLVCGSVSTHLADPVGLDSRYLCAVTDELRFALNRDCGVESERYHIFPFEELNGVPVAFVAGSGVVSKSADRISVFHVGQQNGLQNR
ncbi:hypothetical protein Tco_0751630 [Tanacetum coccineum]|uniref:Uncharacterized protein n=1 Tax=Tanacetum coccineum TaxID=301880 RepID=A0ABQ4Z4K5_9ASTR